MVAHLWFAPAPKPPDTKEQNTGPAYRVRVYISEMIQAYGRFSGNHTWLMVFSICTKPRLGSVFLMKSTMVSRFSCCRIKGLWLPKRLKATLNMTSVPWRKIMSGKTQKHKVNPNQFDGSAQGSPLGLCSINSPGNARGTHLRCSRWNLHQAYAR